MSTAVEEEGAGVSEIPRTQQAGRRRVVRLVFGSLGLVAALALIGSAIAGIVALETERDASGYFTTHTHPYQTSSYALTTQALDVSALEDRLVRLRISATSSGAAKPLFVGIARTQDVEAYLAGVAHDELRDIKFDPFSIDYRRLGTAAPAGLPAGRSIWRAHATGTGTQTIAWPGVTVRVRLVPVPSFTRLPLSRHSIAVA